MVILVELWPHQAGDYIVAKSMFAHLTVWFFAEINFVVHNEAIFSIRSDPHFYAVFRRFRWHILTERQSSLERNHAFVN